VSADSPFGRYPSPFELITWPYNLVVKAGWTFHFDIDATPDMFDLFRKTAFTGEINPGYWSEKVRAGRDEIEGFDPNLFEQQVKQHVVEAIRNGDAPRGIGAEVTRDIFEWGDISHEAGARQALKDFRYEGWTFGETWEWRFATTRRASCTPATRSATASTCGTPPAKAGGRMTSTMEWIRRTYDVPARHGMRIEYDGKPATIVGTRGPYLAFRIDGEKRIAADHPTYRIVYPAVPEPVRPRGWCKHCMQDRAMTARRRDGPPPLERPRLLGTSHLPLVQAVPRLRQAAVEARPQPDPPRRAALNQGDLMTSTPSWRSAIASSGTRCAGRTPSLSLTGSHRSSAPRLVTTSGPRPRHDLPPQALPDRRPAHRGRRRAAVAAGRGRPPARRPAASLPAPRRRGRALALPVGPDRLRPRRMADHPPGGPGLHSSGLPRLDAWRRQVSVTRVSQAIVFVGDEIDDIALDATNGGLHVALGLAAVLNLDGADQDTLDKLAVVFAEAAAVNRNRSLWQVA
jgi:hypothetical protein